MRRTGWPQALLLLGASLLVACATAPTRVPPDGACAGPLAGIDARVARAGVRDADSKLINSVMRGSFLKDASLRREFLSLLNLKP